jgi:flavin reductase (DIM6/NTAB) family NADH-FMN oxidoreductase RutF
MDFSVGEDDNLYSTLAAGVVPRPIAWVSSSDGEVDNLAPFSFFNVVGIRPPIVAFAPVHTREGLKDTAENVRETEEFVVNVVTEDLVGAMNETSGTFPEDVSEFDAVGIERGESVAVEPPRVAASKVAFECVLHDFEDIGASTLVLGRVVHVHLDDDVLREDDKLDVNELDVVGRLVGGLYCHTDDRFELERPP